MKWKADKMSTRANYEFYNKNEELEEIDLACKLFARIDKKGNGKILT